MVRNPDSISYWDDFSRPKIAWASVGETYYSLIDKNMFLLDTNYFFAVDEPELLLAFLNSKIMVHLINIMDTPIGEGGAFRHYKYNLEKLSIIKPNEVDKKELIKLVSEILKTGKSEIIQEKIDAILYKLYGLNDSEIKFVSEFVKL